MDKVGKPFGYRVAQGIASYVENYPKWVQDRESIAFADQVEQRILPKLRGIDLEENEGALNTISNLIAETNDTLLATAFNSGKEENSHGVFMWQGVDRSQGQ